MCGDMDEQEEGCGVTLPEGGTCCSGNPSCFGFEVGVQVCAMGEGFGAVRILFVMVQQQQPSSQPRPFPPSTSPHPAPSLLVLLTGVYVKALCKTITLNCTQPSGSKLAEVDRAACLCTCVQMFADLTVNPPPQKRCLWAVMLAVSNVCPLMSMFALANVVFGRSVLEKRSKAGVKKNYVV